MMWIPSGNRAKVMKNGFFGFIDRRQKLVIPIQYRAVLPFTEGLAAACLDGKRWGYIDPAGNWVIQPQFFDATEFDDGFAQVCVPSGHYRSIDHAGRFASDPVVDRALSAALTRRKGFGLKPMPVSGDRSVVGGWVYGGGHPESRWLRTLAIDPAARYLLIGHSNSQALSLHDRQTLRTLQVIKREGPAVFSPSGNLVFCLDDIQLTYWDIEAEKPRANFGPSAFRDFQRFINDAHFSPDGRTAAFASGATGIVRLYGVPDPSCVLYSPATRNIIRCSCAFIPMVKRSSSTPVQRCLSGIWHGSDGLRNSKVTEALWP